jgi:glutamate carboxypeptidase
MTPAAEILAFLRERQDAMAELLRELALLESPSHVPPLQDPVFDRLAAALAEAGMRSRRLPGRPGRTSGGQLFAVPARRHKGVPAQLLLGHCDTVWPVGTLADIPVEIRDGRLTGPGVYDMKGGLVQGIFALRALKELGLEPPAVPVMFVNSDEEIGSAESTARICRLARCVQRVWVLEPSLGPEGKLKTARKGSARFSVTVRGRAAHSGLEPEKGASAVHELAHVIQAVYGLADPARAVTVNVGVVSGGVRRNVVAPEARAEIDVRGLRWADLEAVEQALRSLHPVVPGTSLEVTGGMDRAPLEPTPANRVLWEAAVRCAGKLGFPLGEGTAGGASDGSTTSQIVATLDGLGAVGDGAHARHEHVRIDRMPERAALLAMLMMEPVAPS